MDKKYRELIEEITLQNEKVVANSMRGVYKTQKAELKTLNALLGKLYIDYGVNGLLKLTTSQKANIGVKTLLKKMTKTLGEDEVAKITSIISGTYLNTYYKTVFINDMGVKASIKFNMAKKEFINAALNNKIDGETFRDRIWINKVSLADKVQESLIKAFEGKTTLDKIAREVREQFNSTAYKSMRLVNYESARLQSQASIDIANDIGIEKHIWSATLDAKTSEEDAANDGIAFDINDDSVSIPSRPNCRCAWINEPYPGWVATSRRDNSTKEVIDYTTYDKWAKEKGI